MHDGLPVSAARNIAAIRERLGDPGSAYDLFREIGDLKESRRILTQEGLAAKLVEGYAGETDLLLQGRAAFQGPEVDGVIYINEGVATAGDFHAVEITESHDYDLVGRIVSQ